MLSAYPDGGDQPAGPVPRVTEAVWLVSLESTQVNGMLWPGLALAITVESEASVVMVVPLAAVMTSPATRPAEEAAVWAMTEVIKAPESTGGLDWP